MWGVFEVRDAATLQLKHEKGFEEDVFRAQLHDEGKLCTLLTVRGYRSGGSVVFRRFETTAWKELGDPRPGTTSYGAVSPDGRLGLTREMGDEPGFGSADEAIIWDLSKLDAEKMPEKKRFVLGNWPGNEDLRQSFSPDGSRLAVVTALGQIELWDSLAG